MHILRSLLPSAAVATVFALVFSSCSSPRQAIYFRDDASKRDSVLYTQPSMPIPEAMLQPGDIIAINISSEMSIKLDQDPVQLFREGGTPFNIAPNVGGQQGGSGGQTAARQGYLIDLDGNIDFPIVGKISVGGLSTRMAKQRIAEKLSTMLKNPIVEVRILNFKVVVMGEVTNPGIVIAPGHTISVLDAIAAAGDATITANKERVMLIRNENGVQTEVRLNLTNRSILSSPYFYLKQGDVLYLEPTSVRLQQNNEFLRVYLPAISSLLATVVSVYGLIRISQASN